MAKRKNAFEEAQALFGRLTQAGGNAISSVRQGLKVTPPKTPYAVQGYNALPQQIRQPINQGINFVARSNIGTIPLNVASGFNQPFVQRNQSMFPTVGSYTQNQIVKSLSTLGNTKKPLFDRAMGGVQGGFSLTPAGTAYNIGVGGAAGLLQSVRTGAKGKQISTNVRKAITNPSDLAGTGLGVKNPFLAAGINVIAGNPKTALKGLKNVKQISKFVKGAMHSGDIDDGLRAIERWRLGSSNLKYAIGKQGQEDSKVITRLAQHYLGKDAIKYYKGDTDKIAQELLNRIRVDQDLPQVSMGIVSNRMGKNTPMAGNQIKTALKTQAPKLSIKGGKGIEKSVLSVLDDSGMPTSGGNKPPSVPPGSKLKVESPSVLSSFNVGRLKISPQAKQKITQTVDEIKPEIEKAVGAKLSNEEAVNFAKTTNKVLEKQVGREQTLEWEGALLKARQKLADAAESGTIDQEYIDNLLTIKTQGTDIARKLQSFSIGADPLTASAKDKILEAVLKVNQNTDEILEAAKGVDFNDYNQAVNFYRKFIKPTKTDYLNLIRYNSMLSSPVTHIVNASSNAINTGFVAPVEKTLTGTLDFLGSKITGKQQTQFAGEGLAYTSGVAKNAGMAAQKFADVLRGKVGSKHLDIDFVPIGTDRRTATLSLPTRLLEASDQFFTTLAKGGETAALNLRKSKGVRVGNIETESSRKAAYRVFRGELFDKDQGSLLNGIDRVTQTILGLRNAKEGWLRTVANFTLPFVKTPMNILKQGVEYSPAGFATIPGAANKTQQLSKAIMGTAGAAMAASFIASGRSTWAEPADPVNRARFRAAGLQPYSIKIGDKWVSFQKLPPSLSFPLAIMAGLHDAEQKKTIDQNQLDVILGAFAKFGNFYSDQSYLKNIGDAVAMTKGSPENATRFFGNYPQQVIPFRALLGWMARLTDPIQRKVDTDKGYLEQQVQNLLKEIPLASRSVPARLDEFDNPIPNQNIIQNAFSPFKMTTERPEEKKFYDAKQKESLLKKNMKAAEKMQAEGKKVNFGDIASADEGIQKNEYQVSPEAPKDLMARISLAAQGFTKDPGNVIKAIFTEERMRKLEGNALILERKQWLNKTSDKGDAVDHIIPLGLGGDNSESNLKYMPKDVKATKDALEKKLIRQLQNGEITRQEAQKQIRAYVDGVESPSPTVKPLNVKVADPQESIIRSTVKKTGRPQENNGKIYYQKGSKVYTIDLKAKLVEPTFSGSPELDKRALSDFSREITKRKNEVEDLISLGKLTTDQGETLLQGLTQKLANVKNKQTTKKSYELTGDPVIDKNIKKQFQSQITSQINDVVGYVQEGKLTAEQGRDIINRLNAKRGSLRGGGGGGRKGKKIKVNYKGVKIPKVTFKAGKLPKLNFKTRIPKYKPVKPLKIRRVYAR